MDFYRAFILEFNGLYIVWVSKDFDMGQHNEGKYNKFLQPPMSKPKETLEKLYEMFKINNLKKKKSCKL